MLLRSQQSCHGSSACARLATHSVRLPGDAPGAAPRQSPQAPRRSRARGPAPTRPPRAPRRTPPQRARCRAAPQTRPTAAAAAPRLGLALPGSRECGSGGQGGRGACVVQKGSRAEAKQVRQSRSLAYMRQACPQRLASAGCRAAQAARGIKHSRSARLLWRRLTHDAPHAHELPLRLQQRRDVGVDALQLLLLHVPAEPRLDGVVVLEGGRGRGDGRVAAGVRNRAWGICEQPRAVLTELAQLPT